jgi:hypothetical protein
LSIIGGGRHSDSSDSSDGSSDGSSDSSDSSDGSSVDEVPGWRVMESEALTWGKGGRMEGGRALTMGMWCKKGRLVAVEAGRTTMATTKTRSDD